MYLAQYSNGTQALRQVGLRSDTHLADAPDLIEAWRKDFVLVTQQLLAADPVDFAVRLTLRERSLERAFVFTAPVEHETLLKQLGKSFENLNQHKADSFQLCLNRKNHDEILGWFPQQCGYVSNQPYDYQNCRLVPDFRLFPLFPKLLTTAFQKNWRFAYQANLRRYQPDTEALRHARKNLIYVNEARLPTGLNNHQQQLVNRLASAPFLIDEYIGVDTGEPQARMHEQMEDQFTATLRPLGFASPPIVWTDVDSVADFLFTGFHTSLLGEVDPLAYMGWAADQELVRSILQWRSPKVRSPAASQPTPAVNADPHDQNFDVFISYSSKDNAIAERVCAGLEKNNRLHCWMAPRNIDPGTTWQGSIMQGLDACRVMVLIFTANSNASQQVLREVNEAVSNNKLLIPFRVENIPPSHEMKYLISTLHWFDAFSGSVDAHIGRLAEVIAKYLKSSAPKS